MRVLRYGATATWIFRGFDLDPSEPVETAYLTVKDAWATAAQEQGPEPPRLQIYVSPTLSDEGIVTTDANGNWVATFNLTALETEDELGPGSPPTRFLWYEVTLFLTDGSILRPFVGQVRMLPDVFSTAGSSS